MKGNKLLSEISLKKIWNKLTKHDEDISTLNSKHTVYGKTVTESSAAVGNTQALPFRRVGNIVFVRCVGNVNVSTAGEYTLNLTIPDGYKPIQNEYIAVTTYSSNSYTIGRVQINSDGSVLYLIPATGARQFCWSATYITYDDFPS